jgi:hypothetical protein
MVSEPIMVVGRNIHASARLARAYIPSLHTRINEIFPVVPQRAQIRAIIIFAKKGLILQNLRASCVDLHSGVAALVVGGTQERQAARVLRAVLDMNAVINLSVRTLAALEDHLVEQQAALLTERLEDLLKRNAGHLNVGRAARGRGAVIAVGFPGDKAVDLRRPVAARDPDGAVHVFSDRLQELFAELPHREETSAGGSFGKARERCA